MTPPGNGLLYRDITFNAIDNTLMTIKEINADRPNSKCKLLLKATGGEIYQDISPDRAGWHLLNFNARIIIPGQKWNGNTGSNEYLFVLMGGNFEAITSAGSWKTVNGRRNPFRGLPHALYLPPQTDYEIIPVGGPVDIACGWSPSDKRFPASFITPADVVRMGVELRGGDNASRQINSILPPGSQCHRLICVEVYTPSGNWSSFPAHKHDRRKVDPLTGKVTEADLEEIYFYKTEKPQGFAYQKVYNDDRSLNELLEAHNNDVVLVPEGYHPVVACHGYNIYYLNFLAGSDQSLANTDDPDHKWIYGTWKGMDPRLPLVTADMNNE
jgi:5-deoxy-glucuronate isomerase